tara:strand:- start:2956 stop:3591 length:636 start_codon:yes stop_codon:yes gene_type:complete
MALKTKILSKDQQQALSPNDSLDQLKLGNERYVNALFNEINISSLRDDSQSGQNPHAIVLSCIDSRVVVEQVFDQALGDVFVARVAGNFANTDIVASMEYACKVAGSKVIVVLGHEGCGAVKAACDNVELGNITSLLSNITPAVNAVKSSVLEPHDSGNSTFVNAAIKENVTQTINQIREMSPILSSLEEDKDIIIVGGVYNLASGRVDWH